MQDHDLSGEFRTGKNIRRLELATRKKRVEVFASEIDGMLLFEGDISVGRRANSSSAIGLEGIGISGASFRWPNARIPFEIESGDHSLIKQAIAHWRDNTPIRLVPKTAADSDFVIFRHSGGSDSDVGRLGGPQFINISVTAGFGTVVHEIGHAVGLWHEHSREDRDQHVDILPDNIKAGAEHNFITHISDGDDIGAYDFGSIMHYPKNAFSRDKNTLDTLRGKKGETFGQRLRLSAGDIGAVRTMYP